jgi:hypothetical protein
LIDGKKAATLRDPTLAADFKTMEIDCIERRYGTGGAGARQRSRLPSPPRLIHSKKSRMKSHPRCGSLTGPWHGLVAVAAGGRDLT